MNLRLIESEIRVAANSTKQQETLDELMTMIKALERLKESSPSLTFVKTGVSSSPLPKFLVEQDIISEQKRMHSPSPLRVGVANADRPVIADQIMALQTSKGRKKVLKKSLHLKKLKAKQIEKKKKTRSNRPNLYSEKRPGETTKKRRHTGIWRWLEELAIIMSKMSLFGLFLILLLLSGVFFGVGFLAAVSNIKEESSNHPTTWQQASQNQNPAGTEGKPNPFLKAAGGIASSFVNQKVASIESKLGGGLLNKAVQKVPPSLQPFALQMQNKFSQQSQAIVGSGGRAFNRVFRPSPFGTTPPSPPSTAHPGAMTPHQSLPSMRQFPPHHSQPHVPYQSAEVIHQSTPSQQAFMQAGQRGQQQGMAPQQPLSYGPQASFGQSYPPSVVGTQSYARIHSPQGLPPSQPVYSHPAPQGYYAPQTAPIQSQPYGMSQPYGYSQALQEQPKMIGMG
ncbi:hypothetical protein [Candidatus Odyssella acanthamoebae]|uniref:Uncharacterized protein n=1 Tax=Candidatus Odyssella acanthamoebae TaxID=91604 RepID=A0A077AWL3_9PROT|nr:hypothetical protein [Candidatus Paracaedibacter acanthamoebae]AIK96851.1 hypothetical protein ID47_09065 [Candidatus Paracaedibacter acanthamoebae]